MAQDQTAEDRKTEVEGYILFPVKQDPAQRLEIQPEINPQPLLPGIVAKTGSRSVRNSEVIYVTGARQHWTAEPLTGEGLLCCCC